MLGTQCIWASLQSYCSLKQYKRSDNIFSMLFFIYNCPVYPLCFPRYFLHALSFAVSIILQFKWYRLDVRNIFNLMSGNDDLNTWKIGLQSRIYGYNISNINIHMNYSTCVKREKWYTCLLLKNGVEINRSYRLTAQAGEDGNWSGKKLFQTSHLSLQLHLIASAHVKNLGCHLACFFT